jgi:hypothetical protein
MRPCNSRRPSARSNKISTGSTVHERETIGTFPLDRYQQHTQHCSSCRKALLVVNRLQIGLLLYFAIAVAMTALFPDALRIKLGLALVVTAFLGLGAYTWLKFWLSPRFYFLDYIHAKK